MSWRLQCACGRIQETLVHRMLHPRLSGLDWEVSIGEIRRSLRDPRYLKALFRKIDGR